jgi:hypothetical protein
VNWLTDRARKLRDRNQPTVPEPQKQGAGGPQKTFLLGVGCQKGGTTWLHHYLRPSPQFERGYRKEYHVFDSRDLPSEQWMRDRILGMADEELQKARRGEPADPVQLHRASMYVDPEFYFDYFAGLLRSRPRIRLTADVTPDYAMLSAERMQNIKSSFEKRRVRTVAAFLMRDPVERVWSQIRMQQGRDPKRFPASAEEMVARLYDEPAYDMRTRYDRTIATVDSVFSEDEVYYGFYETLFSVEEVRKVCELTGIRFREPNFDKMSNVSQAKSMEGLPDDTIRAVANHFRDVYDAVAKRFPDVNLTELWASSRYVD